MSDSAPHRSEPADLPDPLATESSDDVVPGFQPPSRTRYRPSEAWALRWLGTPSR